MLISSKNRLLHMQITADSIGVYTKVFSLSPYQNFDVIRQWSVQWCLISGPSCLIGFPCQYWSPNHLDALQMTKAFRFDLCTFLSSGKLSSHGQTKEFYSLGRYYTPAASNINAFLQISMITNCCHFYYTNE